LRGALTFISRVAVCLTLISWAGAESEQDAFRASSTWAATAGVAGVACTDTEVHDHARVAPHQHHQAVHHRNSQGLRARQLKCSRTHALTHHPCGIGGAVHLEGSSEGPEGAI
jgi:hypothetical protein